MGALNPGAVWDLGKPILLWDPFSLCGIGGEKVFGRSSDAPELVSILVGL